MKRTIMLKASARHPTLSEGEIYEAMGPQALQDLAQRHATAAKQVKIEPPRQKRKYNRRDMTA